MATLSVWKFDSPAGADEAVEILKSLKEERLIQLHDAATVSWEPDAKKPKTRQLNNMTGAGAMGGLFWGMLFGLIFLVPLLGAAIGAGVGALAGSMTDVGIDDDFIKRAREEITPGTSAMFVLTSDAVTDKVRNAFEGMRPQLLFTNLSKEQEDALREVFTE